MRTHPSFLGKAAIAGVGYTDLTKDSGRSVLALAVEACRNAVEDAGLEPREIDGIASFSALDSVPSSAVAAGLATGELTWALDLNLGGQAPSFLVASAAMAIDAGLATNVLVFRALNGRSGARIGSIPYPAPTGQYRFPIGFTAMSQYMAMRARRYMIETGSTEDDLAAVVIRQRRYAADNPRAVRREPLTLEEYRAKPYVAEPFRTVDCTTEVDGACAVLVTSLERARSLRHPPAVVQGAAWSTPDGAGLDVADPHLWDDYSYNCQTHVGRRIWATSGMSAKDVDFAEIYDCFSSAVLFGLEGLGLVGRGEAGPFVRAGETALDGSLPVNTQGGLINEGYVHGMNVVSEAVLQIQGRGGARQVRRNGGCVVTSGTLGDGSAIVLTQDG